jgi:peptide/nickel transport system substrate-binding protein
MGNLDRKRALKLRFRRHLRMQKRQVEELGASAEQRLEDDFFKRLERLGRVRRFLSTWILLVVLLIGCVVAQTRALSTQYQDLVPVAGGTYTEGILGSFSNANPLYAIDLVDASVSRLIFAGLLTYNTENELVGDLAEDWVANEAGTIYTVHLKPNLLWQDGKKLTAEDVAFTYQVAQNPDARSPLYSSWQGIKIAATDARTITFTLPNPLASFPYSLTTGIVPKHLLGKVAMADMRSIAFNTRNPIGAGPFQWQALELNGASLDNREEHIALRPFAQYHGGKPKLSSFVVRTFRTEEQLINSLEKQQVNAIVGLTTMPEQLRGSGEARAYNLPLTAAVMAFFKTSSGVLADAKVRSALVLASDVPSVISGLPYATLPVREPLLRGQPGYTPAYQQPAYNLAAAKTQLDAAGWVPGKDGIRRKGAERLSFQLSAQNNGEYPTVARQLAQQWRKAGVDVKVVIAPDEATFQNTLAYHSYDAILHGISIGVDPDVYVYWGSTQADVRAPVRLNLSEYRSSVADAALEAGRTRLDPALRAEKYKPFLQAWQTEAPALGLYQPRFLYITRGTVYGLTEHAINTDADRFANVQDWQVREARKTPK